MPAAEREICMGKSRRKVNAGTAAICSAFVWGSGQALNRQFEKAIMYFFAQVACIICMPATVSNLYGLITLGDVAMIIDGSKVTHGDNSILLMIKGLLFSLIAIFFICLYILNIKDAYNVAKKKEKGRTVLVGKLWRHHFVNHAFPYAVLAPAIVLVMVFVAVPIIFGLLIAFTNYSAPNHLPPKNLIDWVGFENFLNIFKLPMWNSTFWGVAGWTLLWAIVSTFTCFFGGLLVACLINSKRVKFKKFWRTIYILPWAIPGMISLLVFRNIFNGQFGAINTFLRNSGIISANIPWLSDATLAKVVIVIVNFWLGFPYFMAMMTSAMTSISTDVIEAARIDGANAKQEFRYITLPLVLYTTAPLLVMSFSTNFNNFNVIYFLTDGNPVNTSYMYAGSTDILITWIYKLTTDNRQFNMASVMSILVFAVVASISTFNFLRTKAFKEEDMMG